MVVVVIPEFVVVVVTDVAMTFPLASLSLQIKPLEQILAAA